MKRNDRIELNIDSYGSEGQGVGRCGGMAVFVPGTVLGERVEAVVVKAAPNYAAARLVRVIEASPHRRNCDCPAFETCGGCDIQHIDYAHQLELKRRRVADALARIGGFADVAIDPCVPSPGEYRYRNKAVFGFESRNGKLIGGCIERNSHRVVQAKDCLLQQGAAMNALETVCAWGNAEGITAYDERTRRGLLKNLMVRTSSLGETMIVLVSSAPLKGVSRLVERLKAAVPDLKSAVNNVSNSPHSGILGKKDITLFGSDTVVERILGLDFSVSAQSFLQVNHAQTERLYKTAVDLLDLDERDETADLFCGIGTLSLLMAKRARSVVGIEYVARAVDDARRNARSNGIRNAEFLCGCAEALLPRLVDEGRHISKLLLDPPRAGAMKPVLDAIVKSGVERIVYVSCNPATLARDLKMLADNGAYSVERVIAFDMFPQTAHVECVVLMTKK